MSGLWLQRASACGFVYRKQVEAMLCWCAQNEGYTRFGMLFLFAYVFLLWLPSEALPVRVGEQGLQLKEGELILVLPRR